jgi:hypothetical protein
VVVVVASWVRWWVSCATFVAVAIVVVVVVAVVAAVAVLLWSWSVIVEGGSGMVVVAV